MQSDCDSAANPIPASQGDSDVEAFEAEVAAAQARVQREEAVERASRGPSSRLSSLAGDSPPGSPGQLETLYTGLMQHSGTVLDLATCTRQHAQVSAQQCPSPVRCVTHLGVSADLGAKLNLVDGAVLQLSLGLADPCRTGPHEYSGCPSPCGILFVL
jgi:hypothetical protein